MTSLLFIMAPYYKVLPFLCIMCPLDFLSVMLPAVNDRSMTTVPCTCQWMCVWLHIFLLVNCKSVFCLLCLTFCGHYMYHDCSWSWFCTSLFILLRLLNVFWLSIRRGNLLCPTFPICAIFNCITFIYIKTQMQWPEIVCFLWERERESRMKWK